MIVFDDQNLEQLFIKDKLRELGLSSLEKALWIPYRALWMPTGDLQGSWGGSWCNRKGGYGFGLNEVGLE